MKTVLILLIAIAIFSTYGQINQLVCPSNNLQWMSHPYNCSRYYVCQRGRTHERSCAPGLLFDNINGQCVWPHQANCVLTCPQFDDPQNLVFLPNFEDCTKFYICDHGRAIPRSCANDFKFNSIYNWCDVEGDCENRGNGTIIEDPADQWTTTTARAPDDAGTTSYPGNTEPDDGTWNPDVFRCPLERGPLYFPHPIHCYKFFRCVNSIAYLRECEEGLLFDHIESKCMVDAVCFDPNLSITSKAE